MISKRKKSKQKFGININIIPISNVNYGKPSKNQKKINNKVKIKINNKTQKDIKVYKSNKFLTTDKEIKFSQQNLINNKSIYNLKNLNDQELNSLEYEVAVICNIIGHY